MSDYRPTQDELDDEDFGRTRDRLIWSEMREVRRRYAGKKKRLGAIQGEILDELWAMVRISWEDEAYWQQRFAAEQDDLLYAALRAGDPQPFPKPTATSLREYLGVICGGIQTILLARAEEYEAAERNEKEKADK